MSGYHTTEGAVRVRPDATEGRSNDFILNAVAASSSPTSSSRATARSDVERSEPSGLATNCELVGADMAGPTIRDAVAASLSGIARSAADPAQGQPSIIAPELNLVSGSTGTSKGFPGFRVLSNRREKRVLA